jgi:hypothetical protein
MPTTRGPATDGARDGDGVEVSFERTSLGARPFLLPLGSVREGDKRFDTQKEVMR